MKPTPQNIALIFLSASTLGLGVQLFQTKRQLAEARRAPSLEVKRSEITVAAAPTPIVSPNSNAFTDALDGQQEAGFQNEGGPGGPGGPGNRGGRGGFGQQMAELMKDPEFASAMRVEQEARIEQRYGALFKDLNLAPAQVESLKALLAERENASREVMNTAREQGLDLRSPEAREQLRELTAEFQDEVDANIKAQLGDNVLAALNDYNRTAQQRSTVNSLNERLTYAAQPLNATQAKMLTTILAETGQSAGRNTIITDATIARAQGVLMPSQIEVLKKIQAEQRAQQLVQAKMREAREKAQAARNAARQQNRN